MVSPQVRREAVGILTVERAMGMRRARRRQQYEALHPDADLRYMLRFAAPYD